MSADLAILETAAPDPAPGAVPPASGPAAEVITADLLVEEVSIDGMCGVY